MRTVAAWRAGSATDPGLQRPVNEDRLLVDPLNGIFLVVDGLGGHRAGETAAETAVEVIASELHPLDGHLEERIRHAIAQANNRILELSLGHAEWAGMACVLTLAVMRDDRVTIGHVGDSRLYLSWNGKLRKITSDHSPVGEQEDGGELDEIAAMQHPRRNEVFRDVGSTRHNPDDNDFIEVRSLLFRPDSALLLCSDGLSDAVTSSEMAAIIDQYDGDPERTARDLVEAAKQAGGPDNVSVIFIAGPDFVGRTASLYSETRPRHAITRVRSSPPRRYFQKRSVLWLLIGILLGILGAASWEKRADLSAALSGVFTRLTSHGAPPAAEQH
jgi:PPM family protein phosphatase